MDNIIILYLVKASISLALFYGLYMLLLKKDTFFKLRRSYFLFVMIFSFSFPFLSIEIPMPEQSETQLPTYWLSQIEIGEIVVQEVEAPSINIWTAVFIAVSIISVILAFKLLVQLLSIVKLRVANESEKISSCHIVKLADKRISPFSFFNWIFVNSGMHSMDELEEIIAHEKVHVKQYHSIDVILAEIICICFWWNPFVWLLKNEMKINLEYLADQGVLKAGFNTKEYQYILLQVSNTNTGIPLINNFNVSQLKKRITMMNKKRTSIGKAAKYLFAIPLGVVLLLGNAVQASPELMNLVADEFRIVETISDEPSLYQSGEMTVNNSLAENVKHTGIVQDDKQPLFPGGEKAMYRFIGDNLKYPVKAQDRNVSGPVVAKFIIKSTGEIGTIDIISTADELLKEEVKRVISIMPKWTPAQKNGKNIDSDFTIPVNFSIKGKEMTDEEKNIIAKEQADAITIVAYGKQENGSEAPQSLTAAGQQPSDDKPFSTVEQMPSFPGGEAEMNKYIGKNLKYPVEAQEKGIQGDVTIRFIVSKDGAVTDATILRGFDPACDTAALRVINAMPKWVPGKQKGKIVPVYFTLPIVFKLKDERPTVLILDGKEISEADLKVEMAKREKELKAATKEELVTVQMILSENEVKSKYGDKYKGKKIAEISFEKGQKATTLNITRAKVNKDDKGVHLTVEQMPSFSGGEAEMNKYIGENLKYPAEAQKKGIQGRVTIRFVVTKTGEIKDATIVRGIDPACDAEAVRVINAMPKWIPGKQGGENVDVYFTLPIIFRLKKEDKSQK